MSTVFISYRRQTAAGEARALFNEFAARLGQSAVFMDVDSISLGRDFRNELQKTLAACDFMLVIIDKDWAAAKDERGRIRLETAGDFVRMEIEAALKRDIAVTPVLVRGAQMPAAEELPAQIRDLAYRHGFELSHNRWDSDVREMIRRMRLDVLEPGGQVEPDGRPIAPGETGGRSVPAGLKPRIGREGPRQAAVDDRRRQEPRPLAFVHEAALGRADTAEATAPPPARQRSRKPLVIAGVLGVVCLGGVAAWRANPGVGTTTADLSRPQATPAQTLRAEENPQSVASAQVNLAINYRDGFGGVSKDDREAARLFKLAADQGNALAQASLGVFYETARGGLAKDDSEAARLYKLAADQGDALGQVSLGFFYRLGRGGLPKDDGEAARLYKLAADQGTVLAQASLGAFYRDGRGGLSKDDSEAARLFKLAADQGDASAQAGLGAFYRTGRGGLPKDDREAARLYKLAADQGNASAQANLGFFYLNGLGALAKDDSEAARLFKLAADQGNALGQNNLGVIYENGRGGLPKDDREAARFYKLAADQGYATAQNHLGVFYSDGRGGLSKDDREAARLFKLAANQGHVLAQVNLGGFYENGRGGLPKDDREAARLYKLAADQGSTTAQAGLKRLKD